MQAHPGCFGARNAPASCSYSSTPAYRLFNTHIPLLAAHGPQQFKQQPLRQQRKVAAAQEAPSETATKKQRPPDVAGRPTADDFDYPMPVVSGIASARNTPGQFCVLCFIFAAEVDRKLRSYIMSLGKGIPADRKKIFHTRRHRPSLWRLW